MHQAEEPMVTKIQANVALVLGELEREHWMRTLDAEEVIHWPSVIWIQRTSWLSMVGGAGDMGWKEI